MSPIIFNGVTYASVQEMPADVRKAYEETVGIFSDKNQNGVPDIFEGAMGSGEATVQSVSIHSGKAQIVVDGRVYSGEEEMPAEVRARYKQAMEKIGPLLRDANRNNVPDLLEGALPAQSEAAGLQAASARPVAKRPFLGPMEPVVSDATPKVWLILVGIVVALLAVIGVLAALKFLP